MGCVYILRSSFNTLKFINTNLETVTKQFTVSVVISKSDVFITLSFLCTTQYYQYDQFHPNQSQ